MRVESFKFKGQEITLPIFDEDKIEKNELENEKLENTQDLSEVVKEVENYE